LNALLKPRELADLLGVPITFVYDRTRQAAADPIPHLKIGKYVRFDMDHVREWLADRTK
jgi:excisionase family DNA binding protein